MSVHWIFFGARSMRSFRRTVRTAAIITGANRIVVSGTGGAAASELYTSGSREYLRRCLIHPGCPYSHRKLVPVGWVYHHLWSDSVP